MTAKTSGFRHPSRSVLLTVALLFLLSSLVRIGENTGAAIANEFEQLTEPNEETSDQVTSGEPTDPNIGELLSVLLERERVVEEREQALVQRQVALDRVQEEVENSLALLEDAERRLEETMAAAGTALEGDLDQLTRVYENMKPKDAAALFAQMTPSFAAGFLARMKPESAAAILSGLEPEKAYSVSVILSGRNFNAPTD